MERYAVNLEVILETDDVVIAAHMVHQLVALLDSDVVQETRGVRSVSTGNLRPVSAWDTDI